MFESEGDVLPDIEDGCWNCDYSFDSGKDLVCSRNGCRTTVNKCGEWVEKEINGN